MNLICRCSPTGILSSGRSMIVQIFVQQEALICHASQALLPACHACHVTPRSTLKVHARVLVSHALPQLGAPEADAVLHVRAIPSSSLVMSTPSNDRQPQLSLG